MSLVFSSTLARRGATALAALVSVLALSACFDTNTTECSSGVVCPEGSVCTADGLGCRQLSNQCGNGQMDSGEQCDDGNQIDEDDCRADCQTNTCGDGKRDQQGPVTEECDELGGADSATCNSDCTVPRCGDGRTNPMFTSPGAPRGERCDDGNTVSGDGCSADCASNETCGDDYENDDLPTTGAACLTATGTGTNCPEVCDDGNNIAGDGCSPNCLSEESCRNGILDVAGGPANPPELCDDGDTDDTDECRNNCQAGFGCGNGFVDNDGPSGPSIDEECDNGTTTDNAACDGDCTIPVCGDNRFNSAAGEACDPGTVGVNVASCNADCTVPACGDGKVNRAFTPAGAAGVEQCDDGNTTAGDGCSATCQIETCGNGVTEAINGEQCDDGNLVDTDACRNTCQFPRCGDGLASASEACDEGANTQTCNLDCTVPACGDGKRNPGFTPIGGTGPEQCDDGGTTAGDGCSATCIIETCGNGVTEAINGEQCDDADADDLDACRNTCQLPRCGDGVASVSEVCDTNGNSQTCNLDCTAPSCGDGKVNPGFTPAGGTGPEQCDDGGTTSGDGCSSLCRIEPFALSVARAGGGSGLVTGTAINCGTDCTELFPPGTPVTLTATPSAGSVFTGWSGACTGTLPCMVTMTEARTVVAVFSLNTLTVVKAGTGTGAVTSAPTGINCGADCTEDYNANQVVVLTAAATAGTSTFVGWTGDCMVTGATCTTTMAGAKTITATFDLLNRNLAVTKAGNGTGTVTSAPTGINCGTACANQAADFAHGTSVTLTPSPAPNVTFTGWTGACTGTNACVVLMDAAKSVTATFTLNQHALTVNRAGTGFGTVTSDVGGINCGATCGATYNAGTAVTLTAAASPGSTFTSWSGACTGAGTCMVTVNAATSVTATFTLQTFGLAVTVVGTGTVTSTPAGITCSSGTCNATYNAGTSVTLVADGGASSGFTGWSGTGAPASCTTSPTCVATMDQARAITATFSTSVRTLTVTKSGTGTGTVSSSPVGIVCGATCAFSFAHNTVVTLTPAADATSEFVAWTGNCTGSGSCMVTMSQARNVNAEFRLREVAVNVTVTNTGGAGGTISSVPGAINCTTGTCSANFDATSVVGLVALPNANSTFTGWTGACAATVGTVCTFTVTAPGPIAVGASFAPATRRLIVTKGGGGAGSVGSSPAGITCDVANTDCTQDYNHGTAVTLTASAAPGSTFIGWSGDGASCGSALSCLVTMDAAKTVTATFALQTFALTVTKGGTGAGTVTSNPVGISCNGACPTANASFTSGSVVVLSAVADASSTFTGWTGAGCTGTGSCVVTMSAAQNVTANFTLQTFALTVNVTQAAGQGTVTSAPAGITACAAAGCTASFTSGTSVVLTANLGTAAGVTWGVGQCGSQTATTCTVSMSVARTVDATFN
jgi:cysteine-rich repeat protein